MRGELRGHAYVAHMIPTVRIPASGPLKDSPDVLSPSAPSGEKVDLFRAGEPVAHQHPVEGQCLRSWLTAAHHLL